jgi:hypothetical protein
MNTPKGDLEILEERIKQVEENMEIAYLTGEELLKGLRILHERIAIQRESMKTLFDIIKITAKEMDHVRSSIADSNRSHLDS